MKKLLFLSFLSLSTFLSAQESKMIIGIGAEIGLGHNTLEHNSYSSLTGNNTYKRNQFWLLPVLKLNYNLKILKIKNEYKLKTLFSLGYNNFGGKSKIDNNGYHDYFKFNSVEFGILPTIDFKNQFQFSIGVKSQYLLSATGNYYGNVQQTKNDERIWTETDFKSTFNDYSFSGGVKCRYKYKVITLGIETWFGLTDLNKKNDFSNYYSLSIRENNFRFLIGFEI